MTRAIGTGLWLGGGASVALAPLVAPLEGNSATAIMLAAVMVAFVLGFWFRAD
jgi:hypothetical protein